MRIDHAPGGLDDVRLGEPADHIVGREIVREHPRRIDAHDIFAIFAADHLDPIDAGDAMQARHEIVKCDVGEFGQGADSRTQTEIDDRKSSGGQQPRVDCGTGRQAGRDFAQRRVEQLKTGRRIDAFGESYVDLGAAARGGRAHQRRPITLYAASSSGRVTATSICLGAADRRLSQDDRAIETESRGTPRSGIEAPGSRRAR